MKAHLYPIEELHRITWSETPAHESTRAWLELLAERPSHEWIANVHTKLWVVQAGEAVLPFTVSDHHPENSYVCSPYTHYIRYGSEELHKLENPLLEWLIGALVAVTSRWMLWSRFDDVLYVNNWLLSTNLYPELDAAQCRAIHEALVERFRDRPIIWRSVDTTGNETIDAGLAALDYRRCFSRVVWYQDPSSRAVRRKKSFKIDGSVFRKSGYEVVDAAELPRSAFERIRVLYDQLYLQKYSDFNPQFSTELLYEACRRGLLRVRVLRREDRIDGVYGYYARRGIGTAPLFGYDAELPVETGLYRILSRVYADEAHDEGLLLNCSAGVGSFKKHRGAKPAVESNLIYDQHLPWHRRLPWRFLQLFLDRVGVPLILKMEL